MTNTFRSSTKTRTVCTTVPASTSTYDVNLPAGLYSLALLVKSDVTGTTTTVEVAPLVGENGDQLNGIALSMSEPDDSTGVAVLTLPAGAAGRYANITSSSFSTAPPLVTLGDGGVRVTVTKGGATTGELLEVTLVAVRH